MWDALKEEDARGSDAIPGARHAVSRRGSDGIRDMRRPSSCAQCNRCGQRGVLSDDDLDQPQKVIVVIDDGPGNFRHELLDGRESRFNPDDRVHDPSCCSFEITGYDALFDQDRLLSQPAGMDGRWRRDAIRALTHTSPENPQGKQCGEEG